MKKLIVTTFTLVAAAAAIAHDGPTFNLKDPTIRPGSTVRNDLATGSSIPFDKGYRDLTPEQKAFVKSEYEGMGPDDEPPFPIRGNARIFAGISEVAQTRQAAGKLVMTVLVDADGVGKSVKVFETPEPGTAKGVAFILLNEKYKPALCKGQPCEQEYLVEVALTK